ncbi:MAG: lipoprotein signal peptidase [Proteobacteria bacterium]|nr:lipoprotein signal peptidase [Pseudomonadota bacterium]
MTSSSIRLPRWRSRSGVIANRRAGSWPLQTDKPALAPWLAVALGVCGLDQATKFAASAGLEYGVPHPLLPSFNLTLLHNTGAAFSMLHDAAGWQRWFFSAIALVVAVGLGWWLTRMDRSDRFEVCALVLILGGAVGNLVDRVRLGYVVDFIQLYYQQYSFPAFNIADSAISVGAFMLLLRSAGMGPRAPLRG